MGTELAVLCVSQVDSARYLIRLRQHGSGSLPGPRGHDRSSESSVELMRIDCTTLERSFLRWLLTSLTARGGKRQRVGVEPALPTICLAGAFTPTRRRCLAGDGWSIELEDEEVRLRSRVRAPSSTPDRNHPQRQPRRRETGTCLSNSLYPQTRLGCDPAGAGRGMPTIGPACRRQSAR